MLISGTPKIDRLVSHQDVHGLIKALNSNKDTTMRQAAASALGQMRVAEAVTPLMQLLIGETTAVRQAAILSLGEIGDASAIEPLIAAFKLHDGNEHEAMVATLRRIGSNLSADTLQTHLIEPLLNAFQNESGPIRDLVLELLEELDWQPGQDATGAAYWIMRDQWSRCVEIGTPAIPPLIDALRSSDTHIRQHAAWALSQLGRDAVEPLIPLLQDDDPEVSLVAYTTLVKIGRPAIEPLITILQREGAGVHKAAAEVLGLIGESHVVEPLIEALKDPNPLGREAATEALIKIGKPARDALIQVLRQESDQVRTYAARALEQIGWQPDCSEIGAIYWITKRRWDRCIQMGELAINPLIDILSNDDSEVCSIAVTALVRIGQPTLEPLIAALQHPHPNVRSSAAWALARLRDERALEPLITTLRDRNAQVRQAAMKALGLIGDERVVQPLIDALKCGEEEDRECGFSALSQVGVRMRDKQFEKALVEPVINAFQDELVSLREAASHMLENMGWQPRQNATGAIYWIMRGQLRHCVEIGPAAIEPLLYTLRARDIQTRQNAFWALVNIGEPVIPPLISMLHDTDAEVRQATFWALVKIGRPATAALIDSLQGESALVRRAAIDILGRIGDERAVHPLFAMLDDSDVDIRESAVAALATIGKPARATLTHILQNSQYPIQKRAADTLERIGWQPEPNEQGAIYWITRHNWHKCVQIGAPAVQPLIDALQYCTSEVHKSIIWALAHIGDAAVEPLIATLHDEDASVCGVAAVTLGRIGDSRALQPLIDALEASDERVQRAAAWALQQISIAALQESDKEVYTTAARILGRVGDTEAIQPLIAALKQWDERDHEAAFSALMQMSERMDSATIQADLIAPLVAAFKGEQRSRYKSVTGLLKQMGLQPDRSAIGAAYAIMQGDWKRCVEIGETAIPALIDTLHNTDNAMRQHAAEALAQLEWQPGHDETGAIYWSMHHKWERCVEIGTPAVQPLVARLNHPDEQVRTAVVDALVRLGTDANDTLITALHAPDATVRESAATALGRIGDVEVIQPLIDTITRCRGECCEAVFSALAQIGSHLQGTILQVWLIEPLIAAFKNEDPSRWQRATALIEQIGWTPGQSEVSATYWILQGEWERCIEIGQFAIVPLIDALQSTHRETRLQAAHMLEQIGWQPDQSEQGAIYWIAQGKWSRCVEIGAPAVQPLLASLRYQDKAAREAVVDALVRIGLSAVQPLIVSLRSPQPHVREVAATTLGLLGDTQAVEALIKTLKDEHGGVRAAAVESLAVLGDVRAMKPLMSLLRDKHEPVRVAAAEAVGVRMWGKGHRGDITQLVPRRR